MKKVLIASTALVAAGLMTAGPAAASEKIKLNLGGFSKWWVVGAWQDGVYEAGTGTEYSNVDIKGDNEIYFSGSTKLDNGIEVGIQVEMEAGGGDTGDQIDESYVWIGTGFGKFIVGSENNGIYLLHNTAPDAAGNWNEGGVMTGGNAIAKPTNVTLPGLANAGLTTAPVTSNDTEKLTYVAPTFYGLTVGGSYVPNATSEDDRAPTAAVDMFGVAALYANTFGGVGVKVDAGFAWADTSKSTETNYEWVAGAQLSYAGFTLGGSYRQVIENQKGTSATLTNANNATASLDGYVWDIGLMYATGPYAISLAYITSEVDGAIATSDSDEVTAYQLSGKYNLGAGVDVLASIGHVEYVDEVAVTATGDADHNEGWTVMTGLSLAF
ncbi:porin [Magnetospirillum sp. UT-4]|uniref:porin n=1 Tax=Magnetospirillum sp. UT-4 TaxID=2681467 RepID=UPI00137F9CD4|nr:porin [Magnetospirillum sp. UT-4]CAA7621868.1 conserved exported hypothetical protein [Magnetospirillum sp. UT-4]